MVTSAYLDDLQIHGASTYGLSSMTLGAPAPRTVSDVRPNDHGAVDATLYYGPRNIELEGIVQAADFDSMWTAVDNLKKKLALGSYHTFKFRRSGRSFDEQVVSRVDSTVDILLDQTMVNPVLRYGVSLFCADPRLYSATLSSGSYDPTDAGSGGLDFPLVFPLDFDASATAGHLTVDNEGNIDTPPVFVITGPVTNPILDNDTTGESIYTQSCGLSSSDSLTLDVANRTVTLNGTTNRPDLLDASLTTWFNLVPGVNQLRLRGSGMSTGSTQLAVTFRSARL